MINNKLVHLLIQSGGVTQDKSNACQPHVKKRQKKLKRQKLQIRKKEVRPEDPPRQNMEEDRSHQGGTENEKQAVEEETEDLNEGEALDDHSVGQMSFKVPRKYMPFFNESDEVEGSSNFS